MKLIWHGPLAEREWITQLLSPVVDETVDDPDFRWHGDDAIHVLSGNSSPYMGLADWFAEIGRRGRNITLFQVSDEWFSGHYATYGHFDRVLRNHGTWLADGPGILTLPLGLPNGSSRTTPLVASSARRFTWSFAGQIKASRIAMIDAFRKVGNGFCLDTAAGNPPLDREDYRALLNDSLFLPCPMGNVMLETWRFYEALEFGAIPLVERRPTLDYYRRLLGPHPVPTFYTWRKAAAFAKDVARDRIAADQLQREVNGWWEATKTALPQSVATFLNGPSHAEALSQFAVRRRNRNRRLYRALQIIELLRHQSGGSLIDRVRLTVRRAR